MRKGQISINFLFAIAIVLILFIITIGITFDKRTEIKNTRDQLDKMNLCLLISDSISKIYIGGDGTRITLNSYYTINLKNKFIDVEDVPCNSMIEMSDTELNKGQIIIENKEGEIIIKNG